ncbi:hypothetical protein BC739_002071 [Kutzneria viridogrisea]|uniref:N-acetyltransferase domain-containing protein n=1 Tax=Kutzneria viridogrisea TaxID=47990 RepID=A0ABR6BDB7_9PSEU|nr:hypothetical protein [Kutzneria albida]MBA8924872.1 hypothetical protein [Kutzneria viridogrisea]
MITVELHRDTAAELRLAREMFALIGAEFSEDDSDLDSEALGYVAARDEAELLGFARLLAADTDEDLTLVDVSLVSRTRRMLEGTSHVTDPHEAEVVTALLRAAAELGPIEWHGTDRSPEGAAARALGASAHEEIGRHWGSTDLAAWQPPAGLVAAPTQLLVEDELLTVESRQVQLTALVRDTTALVEYPEHEGAAPAELAAVLAALIERLRAEHSEVTELAVREFDDAELAKAAELAGLHVVERWLTYRSAAQPA